MSTPETPRIWTLKWREIGHGEWGRLVFAAGPALKDGKHVEVVEKAPVDAERERLLDLIGRLLSDDASTAYSAGGDAEALLREYGRLGHRGPGA